MVRSPNVTVDAQKAIIAGNQNGIPVSVLARQFSLSRRAIYGIFDRNRMRGGVIEGSKSGRPRKTSVREDNLIARMSKADPRLSAPEINRKIKANNSIEFSSRTVQRRLVDAGLLGRLPTKKPFISKKNRSARVSCAKKHRNWTVEDWRKELWSDESKFNLFGSDGIKYVRRPEGKRFEPKYQLPTVKHGCGSVMVWGCFGYSGVGPLHFIDGIMDQFVYRDIIKVVLLPFTKQGMPRGWIFQQDNDRKHTSRVEIEFFNKNKIRVLEWPSQSTDLNPIEHLWDELERSLRGLKAKNKEEKCSS